MTMMGSISKYKCVNESEMCEKWYEKAFQMTIDQMKSYKMFIDVDFLHDVAHVALLCALRKCDPSKNNNFKGWLRRYIFYTLNDEIRERTGRSRKDKLPYLSVYDPEKDYEKSKVDKTPKYVRKVEAEDWVKSREKFLTKDVERRVLQLKLKGFSYREIAEKESFSTSVAAFHIQNMFTKMKQKELTCII